MTDFQVSSGFYSGVSDLNWINNSSGLWENNFIPTPNANNMKKSMVITKPNFRETNSNNSSNSISSSGGFFQNSFDSTKVPVSIKNSEFINVSNSEMWSNNSIGGVVSNTVNPLKNSNSIGISQNIGLVPSSSTSTPSTVPQQQQQQQQQAQTDSPSPLSGSNSILPPPKRKGLIKAHSEDSFQPIQQQFLAQLQQQQLQQSQDDENNASNGEQDIEEEINGQSRYKTELCRSFAETGACRYGIKCQFAHGKDELRPVVRHPKYKTETCKTFHSTGSCPYGSRCRFIHISPNTVLPVDENQLAVLQQQHLQQQQQPHMTRQNSSPQLNLQNHHLQPLLQQLQQLKIQPTLQQLQQLQQQMQLQQQQQQQQQQMNQQQQQQQKQAPQQPLHQSQPIPKPSIQWSNSWTSVDEASNAVTPAKSPSKKRLNVFKTICSNSNWN
ncbi:hypothetical protein DLAC_00060 [Tieghemostelium lacteum]|uniref:C3H1-type domain-containing protein n=1 Tax=Tieghemostelium lacteum TaxID=361077 RepID=A0A152A8Q4_TIELA|nr:hypothetical protein DLAC_00060 [Tieghemostelium lacteum]|eukprot:KYR02613.1 hypothetical protein DLAC_00060 [Tieghemostelium lacteum]